MRTLTLRPVQLLVLNHVTPDQDGMLVGVADVNICFLPESAFRYS